MEVLIEPTTDRDFEHLRSNEYRWMRLRCVETGARSNQLISYDISLESVLYHARNLASAAPGATHELAINQPAGRVGGEGHG